jgi:hypothetical protein
MSFGAKAMRDIRAGGGANGNGNGNVNGRASVSSTTSNTPPPSAMSQRSSAAPKKHNNSPTLKSREGFDFAENLRARAERSSISSVSGMQGFSQGQHHRAKSITAMESLPKPELPKAKKAPDAFQERILKGDFYMD